MNVEWFDASKVTPPVAEGNEQWTPLLWLALNNGSAVIGEGLHRPKTATYSALMHDWFSDGCQVGDIVIAWAHIEAPVFTGEMRT